MFASLARPMLMPPAPVGSSAALDSRATAYSEVPATLRLANAAAAAAAPAVSALADELSDADLEHVVGGLARSFIPPMFTRGDSHVVSDL
jgi:hypothetical protein